MTDYTPKNLNETELVLLIGRTYERPGTLALYTSAEVHEPFFTAPLAYNLDQTGITINAKLLGFTDIILVGESALTSLRDYMLAIMLHENNPGYQTTFEKSNRMRSGIKSFLSLAQYYISSEAPNALAGIQEQIRKSSIMGSLEKIITSSPVVSDNRQILQI